MTVFAQKSSTKVITFYIREYNSQLNLTLNGTQIPVTPTTKIHGTTYDQGMTFEPHIIDLTNKTRSRLNVLKAHTTTTFGLHKESIVNVYKQFLRPIISYASRAWSSDLANTHTQRLSRESKIPRWASPQDAPNPPPSPISKQRPKFYP